MVKLSKLSITHRRCVGREETGFGMAGWPVYEYLCPECGKWGAGSDVTLLLPDGTETMLCPKCADEVCADELPPKTESN